MERSVIAGRSKRTVTPANTPLTTPRRGDAFAEPMMIPPMANISAITFASGPTIQRIDASAMNATLTSPTRAQSRGARPGTDHGMTSVSRRNNSPVRLSTSHASHHKSGHHQHADHTVLSGLHAADASCCGYNQVAAHHPPPKGLFVTFCAGTIGTDLADAQRALVNEQEQRAQEEARHRTEMGHWMRERQTLIAENELLKQQLKDAEQKLVSETKDIRVLKEEFERRWRAEMEVSAKARASELIAKSQYQSQQAEIARYHGVLQQLTSQFEEKCELLRRTEATALEQLRRANEYINKYDAARGKADQNDLEMQRLAADLKTKEELVKGLQRQLYEANERVNSVHMFKDSIMSVAARNQHRMQKSNPKTSVLTTLNTSTTSSLLPRRSSKLSDKYYGDIQAATRSQSAEGFRTGVDEAPSSPYNSKRPSSPYRL